MMSHFNSTKYNINLKRQGHPEKFFMINTFASLKDHLKKVSSIKLSEQLQSAFKFLEVIITNIGQRDVFAEFLSRINKFKDENNVNIVKYRLGAILEAEINKIDKFKFKPAPLVSFLTDFAKKINALDYIEFFPDFIEHNSLFAFKQIFESYFGFIIQKNMKLNKDGDNFLDSKDYSLSYFTRLYGSALEFKESNDSLFLKIEFLYLAFKKTQTDEGNFSLDYDIDQLSQIDKLKFVLYRAFWDVVFVKNNKIENEYVQKLISLIKFPAPFKNCLHAIKNDFPNKSKDPVEKIILDGINKELPIYFKFSETKNISYLQQLILDNPLLQSLVASAEKKHDIPLKDLNTESLEEIQLNTDENQY